MTTIRCERCGKEYPEDGKHYFDACMATVLEERDRLRSFVAAGDPDARQRSFGMCSSEPRTSAACSSTRFRGRRSVAQSYSRKLAHSNLRSIYSGARLF